MSEILRLSYRLRHLERLSRHLKTLGSRNRTLPPKKRQRALDSISTNSPAVTAQTFEELELDDSQKMGYVYKCLGSEILCLRLATHVTNPTSHTFETFITDLIMQGGDADTNAAAAGVLLVTYLSFSRLPANCSDGIKHREWLMEKYLALSCLVGIGEGDVVENVDTGVYGGKEPTTEKEVKDIGRGVFRRRGGRKKRGLSHGRRVSEGF